MKNKRVTTFLILALFATILLSYQYVKLRFEYNNLRSEAKYEFMQHLSLSLSSASVVDINKINEGDKGNIEELRRMNEEINKLSSIPEIVSEQDFVLVDKADMIACELIMMNILTKINKEKLTEEDGRAFNLLGQDLKLIYGYVDKNEKFGRKKYETEVSPNLKILKPFHMD